MRGDEFCRKLRRNPTTSEKVFWEAVKNRKFLNNGKETFFIGDFYCHESKLVVEIDGKIHYYNKKHDELRTYIMNYLGLDVIRFKNEEIENNLENVLIKLKKYFYRTNNSTP
ncbi:MAG: DUF559 domain-containing protein [Bacteroidota bacterium]|nr:DUF559 domain-containing protein [Bacteroidota bacterium]